MTDGSYQPLVGIQRTPDEDVVATLRRVKITGDSDGLFIWTNDEFTYTIIGYDVDISTRYDAVALLGSSYIRKRSSSTTARSRSASRRRFRSISPTL